MTVGSGALHGFHLREVAPLPLPSSTLIMDLCHLLSISITATSKLGWRDCKEGFTQRLLWHVRLCHGMLSPGQTQRGMPIENSKAAKIEENYRDVVWDGLESGGIPAGRNNDDNEEEARREDTHDNDAATRKFATHLDD
jgi:hypothetical protein